METQVFKRFFRPEWSIFKPFGVGRHPNNKGSGDLALGSAFDGTGERL
jgi:hypothetical protein